MTSAGESLEWQGFVVADRESNCTGVSVAICKVSLRVGISGKTTGEFDEL